MWKLTQAMQAALQPELEGSDRVEIPLIDWIMKIDRNLDHLNKILHDCIYETLERHCFNYARYRRAEPGQSELPEEEARRQAELYTQKGLDGAEYSNLLKENSSNIGTGKNQKKLNFVLKGYEHSSWQHTNQMKLISTYVYFNSKIDTRQGGFKLLMDPVNVVDRERRGWDVRKDGVLISYIADGHAKHLQACAAADTKALLHAVESVRMTVPQSAEQIISNVERFSDSNSNEDQMMSPFVETENGEYAIQGIQDSLIYDDMFIISPIQDMGSNQLMATKLRAEDFNIDFWKAKSAQN
jgi:hypothetical protein